MNRPLLKTENGMVCTENLFFPSLTSGMLSWIYRLRYSFIRCTTCPVPFLPPSTPFIGGKSVLEFISIILIALVSALLCVKVDGDGAGNVASFVAGASVLCGLRNNVLTVFFAISFERALFWHKIIAIISIGFSLLHGIQLFDLDDGEGQTGLVLLLLMGLTAGSYLVKKYFFEIFYYFHTVVFIGITVLCFLHGATLMGISGCVWGADLFVRYVLTRNKVRARLTLLPAGVIKITFTKPFAYSTGQYCFVMIPELSMFQFHPFTISSAPYEEEISLHVRSLGNWTRQLHHMVESEVKQLSDEEREAGRARGMAGALGSVERDVYVEGPFGILSVDIQDPAYSVILLIAGGIGVTPTQSVFNHLIHEHMTKQRNVRKCIFVWSVKDRAMADTISPNAGSVSGRHNSQLLLAPPIPLSFQPDLLTRPRSHSSPRVMNNTETNPVVNMQSAVPVRLQSEDLEDVSLRTFSDNNDLSSPSVFHCEFYLTALRNEADFAKAGIDRNQQPYLRFGRPDLFDVFLRVASLCSKEGIPRVPVIVCGPEVMVSDVQKLCSKRHSGIQFDLHKEEFDF